MVEGLNSRKLSSNLQEYKQGRLLNQDLLPIKLQEIDLPNKVLLLPLQVLQQEQGQHQVLLTELQQLQEQLQLL